MGGFTPGGKAHRIMDRLAEGPADRADLADLIRGPNQTPAAARSRAWRFIVQLRAEGLATMHGTKVSLTSSGYRALSALDDQLDAVGAKTSVRIFASKAA